MGPSDRSTRMGRLLLFCPTTMGRLLLFSSHTTIATLLLFNVLPMLFSASKGSTGVVVVFACTTAGTFIDLYVTCAHHRITYLILLRKNVRII